MNTEPKRKLVSGASKSSNLMSRCSLWILALFLIGPIFPLPSNARDTVGWAEYVRIYPGNLLVEARIDTGAELSSLHCDCITPFEREGEKWVSFVVETSDGRPVLMEQRVLRIAKIKRHFGEVQERMVINLGVCLGATYKEAEVTLVDRSGLTYPMLIGRDFLGGDFLVDPSASHQIKSQCSGP